MELISETPLNVYQLKKELDNIKKRDKELNFRASKVEEYLNQFATAKEADKLAEKLTKLNIPRLKDQHINKIIDIMPANLNDLKVVLQGYTVTLNPESMKKIVDAVNDFLGSK